jgi:biopolymer transport protein ExbD
MRHHHYRRRKKEAPNLDVTTFMNLMVALVPFLLITAVFSRITIVELDLPSSNSSGAVSEPGFRPEVIVREDGMEITNGRQVIAALPKVDGEHDMQTLSAYMLSLKREYPDATAASVLLEPQIPYDYLVRVMDVVRSAEIEAPTDVVDGAPQQVALNAEGQSQTGLVRVALFPDISVGEAPQ